MNSNIYINEFLNWCAAVVLAETCLLPKPIEEWTMEDLQKLNGILMQDAELRGDVKTIPQYKPGKIRAFGTIISRKQTISPLHSEINKMINILPKMDSYCATQEVDQFLSADELEVHDKFFMRIPSAAKLPFFAEEYIKTLKEMWSKSDEYTCAAYAHNGLTKAAFWYDGNGRLARLIANTILMKAGRVPMLMDVNYYDAVSQADGNFNILTWAFRGYEAKTAADFRPLLTDFEGVSIMQAPAAKRAIIDAYNGISLTNPNYEQKLEELKYLCLDALGLVARP